MWNADQSSVLIVCVPQEGPFWPMTLKPTQHHSGLWATSPSELHGSPTVAPRMHYIVIMHMAINNSLRETVMVWTYKAHIITLHYRSHIWTEKNVQRTTWLSSLLFSLSGMPCPLPAILNNASRACVQSQRICVCVCDQSSEDHSQAEQTSLSCVSATASSSSCHTLTHAYAHITCRIF